MDYFNKFFDNIYVISLYDKLQRWKKMKKQFSQRNIQINRLIATDGRCKDQNPEGCIAKLNTFSVIFGKNLNYVLKPKSKLTERTAAISLSLTTMKIIQNAVKNKDPFTLICEDDIVLPRDFSGKFKNIISQLKTSNKMNWDTLYLGIGGFGGNNDMSLTKTKNTPYLSDIAKYEGEEYYVKNKDDLRSYCYDKGWCKYITKNVVRSYRPGGTWCYAVSLKGAKKILKLFNDQDVIHIDQFYMNNVENNKIIAYACNPPIVMHEAGFARPDSDIPWS